MLAVPVRVASTTLSIEVVQTSADLSDALTRLPDLRFSSSSPDRGRVIDVEDTVRYEKVTGVGAAMTGSLAWLLHDKLAAATRTAVMDDLFGDRGRTWTFVVVPMGGSDCTAAGRPYTYDDLPAGKSDPRLLHFSVAHDDAYIVPTLRQMLAVNPRIEILATPWRPPAWMKANGALNNTQAKGTLLPSAYKFSEILIGSLRSCASAVAIWNVALDPSGGPVQNPTAAAAGAPASSRSTNAATR